MKKNAKSFRLDLNYYGEQRKPFYRLTLSVEMIAPPEESFFQKYQQITERQAQSIIDQLAVDGFLKRAVETSKLDHLKIPNPSYLVRMRAGEMDLTESLAVWDLSTFQRFDRLHGILNGEAAKSMNFLLGRLGGIRGALERDAEAKQAVISMVEWPGYGRNGDRLIVRFTVQADGGFRYDDKSGKLSADELKQLQDQIVAADVGPGAEDATTLTFRWLDATGKRHEKVFTNPNATDRKKLVATLEGFAKKK